MASASCCDSVGTGPTSGSTIGQRRCNVEVHVRHGLAVGGSVLLPDRYAVRVNGCGDRTRRSNDTSHQAVELVRLHVEQGWAMLHRDDKNVHATPLLPRHQGCCRLVPIQDCVRATPRQILAEGTGIIDWDLQRHAPTLPMTPSNNPACRAAGGGNKSAFSAAPERHPHPMEPMARSRRRTRMTRGGLLVTAFLTLMALCIVLIAVTIAVSGGCTQHVTPTLVTPLPPGASTGAGVGGPYAPTCRPNQHHEAVAVGLLAAFGFAGGIVTVSRGRRWQ